jgi:hypothetical protein
LSYNSPNTPKLLLLKNCNRGSAANAGFHTAGLAPAMLFQTAKLAQHAFPAKFEFTGARLLLSGPRLSKPNSGVVLATRAKRDSR